MIKWDLHRALKYFYRKWLLFFSAAGLSEPKLGMKRSRSEKNGVTYLQTEKKKRKITMSLIEAGAVAGDHGTREEDIVDENEPATYVKLNAEEGL